ncbi:MAG: hypothetical protein KIT09_24595 [Bryobacteraceae bacterium]|nr:hypothetical protein [Bryobacteraceae bacterium]
MRNWKAIAAGLGPPIPEDDIARASGPLEALEAAFRPLAQAIPPETEPAYLMLVEPEEEQ